MRPTKRNWPVWVQDDQSYFFVLKGADLQTLPLLGMTIGLRIESENGVVEMSSASPSGLVILDQAVPINEGVLQVTFTQAQQKSFLTRTPPTYEMFYVDGGRRYPFAYGQIEAQNAVSPT